MPLHAAASCIRCKRGADVEDVKAAIFAGEVCQCKCGSLVKPDIVFFGEVSAHECMHTDQKHRPCNHPAHGATQQLLVCLCTCHLQNLPDRFERQRKRDMPECDLLIVMGTSLTVHPFAGLLSEFLEPTAM
jgi:NAD-dependent SIR2 family protein deacetylase